MVVDFALSSCKVSEAEMERIMTAYGTDVKRMCYLQLEDVHLAEDAAQETFIKVWRSGGSFRGECREKTWIMRIAINTCRDMRRGAWFRRVNRRYTPETWPEAAAETPSALLQEDIQALPPRYREIILLHYYQGMELAEAAAALNVSVNTAKSRLFRARKLLKAELEGGEGE